jgi:hypothetical protein
VAGLAASRIGATLRVLDIRVTPPAEAADIAEAMARASSRA